MPIQLGEWGSNAETEGHRVCEGIIQQPSPFYNGNFSSSIWGNPPTPPLWRDTPPSNASCSTSCGHPLVFSSSDKQTKESVMSCKNEPSDKEEKASKWLGDFSFRQPARPQESLNSPFSFGFPTPSPPPPSAPSSSSVCDQSTLTGSSCSQSHFAGKSADVNERKNPINGSYTMFDKGSSQCFTQVTAFSLKELSNKWGSMLQSQDGLHGSFDSQSPLHGSCTFDASVVGPAFSKEGVQPMEQSYGNPFAGADKHVGSLHKQQSKEGIQNIEQSYGNPFAGADKHTGSLHKQQSSHQFIGISSDGPNLINCNRMPSLFRQKSNSGAFVFGSCPASGTSANVGFSLQKDACASAAGSMPRSSVTKTKFKKHNNFVKRRSSMAPGDRAFQPGPSKSSMDPSPFSNSVLNFTVGVSDEGCPRHSEPGPKNMNSTDSGCGPATGLQDPRATAQKISSSFGANREDSQSSLFFAGTASTFSNQYTESVASLSEGYTSEQRSVTQHAQTFGEQFDTWHPFLQKEGKSCGLDTDFVGVALSKGTSHSNNSGKKHWKSEASEKAAFSYEELLKPSMEVNRTSEGSKLAEFNMNSPGKLSMEDLRDRAGKWGRPGEEIRRQKENQEPNFIFGFQKASKPFVFGASRTSGSTKHASLSDDMNKNERSSKGSKESKVLEHLIAKLGERMADLGKSHDTQSDHAACTGETVAEGIKEFKASEEFCKRLAKGERLEEEVKNKTTDRSQEAANVIEKNIDLNQSIDELRKQLAKLGSLDHQVDRGSDKTGKGRFSSKGARYDMEHAVRELREQIAKLGNFDEKRKEDTGAKVKCFASEAHDSSAIEHAVEELREQIAKLGRAARDNNQDNYSASRLQEQLVEELCERMVTLGKAAEKGNNHNLDQESKAKTDQKKVQEVFVFGGNNETAQKENGSSGFHWPKAFAGSGGAAAQLNPFTTISHFNLFPSNAFVGPQSSSSFLTVNPFTAGQTPPFAKAFVGPQSSSFPTVNPFTAGQPPPFAEAFAGPQSSNSFPMVNPFTAGQPPPFAEAFAGPQSSSSFPMVNPLTAGQPPLFAEAHNGAKSSASEISSASNDTEEQPSHQGFEFHGTKGPLSGMSTQRKHGRARFNIRSCEKGNLMRSKRSSGLHGDIHCTSTADNACSPMDFSPCADKFAPSPKIGSSEAQQAPVQKSPEPKSVEAESMNVEELTMATSNLTVGNEDGSSKGDHSRSFEHSSAEANPFVLRQTKGRWKRAPRKKPVSTEDSSSSKWWDSKPEFIFGSKMAHTAEEHVQNSVPGERFNLSSLSPLADPHGVGARENPLRKTTGNQGSAFFVNEKGENSTQKAASQKTGQPFRISRLVKEQKASNIAREVPSSPNATKSATAEEVCEKWRIRGNQAYAKGEYEKAEDCYSRGVGSVSPETTSQSCIRASMLCYSNRAATRMAVGRMREALADCKQAMMLDPSFLRARLRAANCHLALGESNAATSLFVECWKCVRETGSSDMKIVEEAMDGVKKSQQFDNLLERASKLCQGETSTDASAALHPLNEALLISPFSEALLELKVQALFSLRRFEDVLQLCEQTLPAAEENHVVEPHHKLSVHKDIVSVNLWRWRMRGKSLFHLGRLEESSSLLTKYEEAICSISFNKTANTESVGAILINIHDLLQHKAAGNEAFQAGRHVEAVEHYTAALACSGESRPYNAVCFCNRAAASQALGHIADAIADCSRAIVLDSHYAKAISRRATLHEIIRDYGQTCNDLVRLITLLEGQEAPSKSPKSTRAGSKNSQDLRQARDRLEKATKELKKGCVVDHYLILGLDVSCSSNDIKKAYRKAALKHHPDKAGQFLVRGDSGDDGSLWKEVGDEVRRDAERLFKLIGESYAILSDPTKRAQYDVENHISRARNFPEYGSTEDYCSPCEKTSRRQRDGWSGHYPRYQRWQNGPDAAQPDTYSERNRHDSTSSEYSRHRGRRTDFVFRSEY